MKRFEKNLSGSFASRHVGPSQHEIKTMLDFLGMSSIDELITQTIPAQIRSEQKKPLRKAVSEFEALEELRVLALQNQVFRSFIGLGYSETVTPPVIHRNILENPGWYTQYTPYQAEISQGRLEALLNFQTMVSDLTGLPVSNASLLDEATAAAEAMALSLAVYTGPSTRKFFVAQDCHPQTIAVIKTRARPLDIEVLVGKQEDFDFDKSPVFGAVFQYPNTRGELSDYTSLIDKVKKQKTIVTLVSDLLALTLIKSPGELGADISVGSSQRFGVPMGFGGPHAAFLSTRDEYKRQIPGRIVGVSHDAFGKKAIRLALQTREQHIRREKATSNICTSQVLLAVMASMYAVYHGPRGLKDIALKVHGLAKLFQLGLEASGFPKFQKQFFDTVTVSVGTNRQAQILKLATARKMNVRALGEDEVSVSFGEPHTINDVRELLEVFNEGCPLSFQLQDLNLGTSAFGALERKSEYLAHPIFNKYHSETEMLRYIKRLEAKDLSLTTSMIPLGSCTMKLNAAAEMLPVSWAEFSRIHPFAPSAQVKGYLTLIKELENDLATVTGFDAVSLQPNAGSQGEYAGLLTILKYLESIGQSNRSVCLIPKSAHGTNPATATMAGMKVVVVECDSQGNIDLADLKKKADENRSEVAALMVTYPSTHGVFEEKIKEICEIVHSVGGQVYMDGANMNAQIGFTSPATIGADVCHLNLHKTFCIPHGGGGPGMGPIGVKAHLAPFLPNHPVVNMDKPQGFGTISAAPWGSPSILPISWMYIRMMGDDGLKQATSVAILNANYLAKKLEPYFPVLYKGTNGKVAHECIIDLRPAKTTTGVEVEDVAKRLMDYGFHAPTVSFPVIGTLMIEPTESESLRELDRFCDALKGIHEEIKEIQNGKADTKNNVLKNSPHPLHVVTATEWNYPYSREKAAFPAPSTLEHKFWPSVGRIDGVYGDRNLMCSCPPVDEYSN